MWNSRGVRPGFLGACALLHGFCVTPWSLHIPFFCFVWVLLQTPLLATYPLYALALRGTRFRVRSFVYPFLLGLGLWAYGVWWFADGG